MGTAMSAAEAQQLLDDETKRLETSSWDEVKLLVDQQLYKEVIAPSRTKYGIELTGFWDEPPRRSRPGTLRFLLEIFRYDVRTGWSGPLLSKELLRKQA